MQPKKEQNVIETLATLNTMLKEKCGGKLSLTFDKYKKMIRKSNVSAYSLSEPTSSGALAPQYLLCLMYEGRCISSIELRIVSATRSVEISSKTHPSYEGRKYNLLLRTVATILASQLTLPSRTHTMRTRSQTISRAPRKKYVLRLVSRAINPVSTLLLVKYFNATNKEFDTYLQKEGILKPNLTMEHVRKFEEGRWDNVSDEDIENNSDFGEPLLLTVNFNDRVTMQRVKQVFLETLDRIGCPD
jgi:hypothetical protein